MFGTIRETKNVQEKQIIPTSKEMETLTKINFEIEIENQNPAIRNFIAKVPLHWKIDQVGRFYQNFHELAFTPYFLKKSVIFSFQGQKLKPHFRLKNLTLKTFDSQSNYISKI